MIKFKFSIYASNVDGQKDLGIIKVYTYAGYHISNDKFELEFSCYQ